MKRVLSKKITQSARNEACAFRGPTCNYDPETTVFCHVVTKSMSAMGGKTHDFFGFYGCSACHSWYEANRNISENGAFEIALNAVCETQGKLYAKGLICV